MNESVSLALAWAVGGMLGAMFFGGLWWTTCRGIRSKHPALWFSCSLVLRMSMALAGFYFVSAGRWQRALLCLLGFFMARVTVMWLTKPSGRICISPVGEADHAPES
jgi:F1F0 ATPase subunit 2